MTTPKLTLTASKAATEGGANGIFTINLDTPAPAGGLLVRYNVAGSSAASSDYTLLAGEAISALTGNSFLIAAGASRATLQVQATADGLTEAVEAVALTLNVGDSAGVSFAAQQTFTVGNEPLSFSLGDVNGDGALDVLTANTGSDNVSLLLGNGQGGFTTQKTFKVNDGPFSVSLGDVNSDGALDVLTASYYTDTVSLLLGNGQGGFTEQQTLAVGDAPRSVSLGDVNGDGAQGYLIKNTRPLEQDQRESK